MKSSVILVSILLFPLAAAAAGGDTVAEIVIEGNENISRSGVLSYVKTRPGREYNEKVVREDCDRLRESGRFKTVVGTAKKTPAGVVVTFRIEERPLITAVEVTGNKKFTTDELLTGTGVAAGEPLDEAAIASLKQAIADRYTTEGYPYAEVAVDRSALDADRRVAVTIVEGPAVVVDDVDFEGNYYYNDLELQLKTKTRAKLWPFIAGDFNEEKIDNDVATIRKIYLAEGFLDVEVSRRLDPSADKSEMTVTFIINEGGRYRVNAVSFAGNTVFADAELRERLQLRQSRFFTADAHRTDVEAIESSYGELGYVDAAVKADKRFVSPDAPLPDWAAGLDGGRPSLVNLVYEIEENDRYTVGDVVIKGNTITQDRVIRREVRLFPEEGDENICNTKAMDRSETTLKSMQLFETVAVTPVDAGRPGVKDILVEVEEGRTAELMVGAGINSNDGLIGTFSLTERNFDILNWPGSFGDLFKPGTFKGAGQRLNITAQPGTEVSRFSLAWSTPYIFDKPYSFGTNAYYFDRDYESYDLSRVGVRMHVGHRFENRWQGRLGMRLENIETDMDSQLQVPVEIYNDRGSHNLLGLSGTLVRDRTDNRLLPSAGDRLSFSYEQVMGDYSFGTFRTSYTIYHTVYRDALNRKHILAGRAKFGQIFGDAPTFERFYGGGIGSIRGFEFRGISPRGTYPNGRPHDDPIGGDMMFFLGGEYTFPIVSDTLRGVVFLDSGTVESDFDLTTYRVSTGFGVRWKIPLLGPVPMSLNIGIPLIKDENDDTEVFSFTIGARF